LLILRPQAQTTIIVALSPFRSWLKQPMPFRPDPNGLHLIIFFYFNTFQCTFSSFKQLECDIARYPYTQYFSWFNDILPNKFFVNTKFYAYIIFFSQSSTVQTWIIFYATHTPFSRTMTISHQHITNTH
jgi:hypothetical protein